jgi:hypothetical protein
MPCPLFLPDPDRKRSHLPLSGIFGGVCQADPAAELTTDKLTRCCNPGYARAHCEHAAAIDADSNRFLVRGADDGFIEIAWATEFNHHPLAVGTLRIPRTLPEVSAPLEQQARACAAAYLRQTGQL